MQQWAWLGPTKFLRPGQDWAYILQAWAEKILNTSGPNKNINTKPTLLILILIKTDYKLYFRLMFKIISLVLHSCKLTPCMEYSVTSVLWALYIGMQINLFSTIGLPMVSF